MKEWILLICINLPCDQSQWEVRTGPVPMSIRTWPSEAECIAEGLDGVQTGKWDRSICHPVREQVDKKKIAKESKRE